MSSQNIIPATKIESGNLECDIFLGIDNQQNSYFLKGNVLIKNSASKNYQYNNVSLGKIAKVDFQNPLEIVVFYKNFNTVVLLDNQLNEIKKIDFNLFPIPLNLEAVALSSQNQIWIYDSISSKIGLINVNTDSIKWISTMLENPILHYESDYTHFYWTDINLSLYRISIYGTIEKLGILPKFEAIQLTKSKNLIYQIEHQLFYYDLTSMSSSKIAIDEKIISKFFFRDGILSIFTQNEITNYKIFN
ncbi:hypothetical protein [Flavobacterium lacisediminis]|uniref:Uncharacterized protein n=1 Tax=Flavobacterium lacisediminis TaxID=2989705 RepID=A0ABT3EHT0_9FLAO|nr:hypothetical protein [Flavobacterium lacisediminis]MCW1148135.1 hypothetical protein [Flavobacterium lacisediminis]